jgi:hypothetical protein
MRNHVWSAEARPGPSRRSSWTAAEPSISAAARPSRRTRETKHGLPAAIVARAATPHQNLPTTSKDHGREMRSNWASAFPRRPNSPCDKNRSRRCSLKGFTPRQGFEFAGRRPRLLLGISVPNFALAAFLVYLLSVRLHILPVAGWGTLSQAVLPSNRLCEELARLEHRPWRNYGGQEAISPNQLARLLDQFEITPKLRIRPPANPQKTSNVAVLRYGGGGGMSAQASQWCGSVFTRRAGGGKAQRFCSPKCRRAMDSAARAWVRNEMARGRLTVFQLQRARCPEPDPEAAWPGGWIAGSGDRCPF